MPLRLAYLSAGQIALGRFNQFADAPRVGFPMTVTRQRVGPAAGFDQNIRPDEAGIDMHGRHPGDADAHFVLAEP